MIVTISGTPGSGKSTVSKIIAQKLNYQRIYVGGIRRKLAKQKGMTLEELNHYALTHPETDVDIDQEVVAKARNIDQQNKDVLVEGRPHFHLLPESLKIYIKVELNEGAKRIWKDLQNQETKEARNEGDFSSLEEMKQEILNREENDAQRYQKYYQIDHHQESNYDFVIDTTKITAEQAAQKIIEFLKTKHS